MQPNFLPTQTGPTPGQSPSLKDVPTESTSPNLLKKKELPAWLKRAPIFGGGLLVVGMLVWLGVQIFSHRDMIPFIGEQPLPDIVVDAAHGEDNFDLRPSRWESLGMRRDSEIIISSQTDMDPELVAKHVRTEPPMEFAIVKKTNRQLILRPKKEYDERTVYKMSLATVYYPTEQERKIREYRWAYQTKRPFAVEATLPRDAATGVPQNTGIEIAFSSMELDAQAAQRAFRIEPATEGSFRIQGAILTFVPKKNLLPNTLYSVTIDKSLTPKGDPATLSENTIFRFQTGSSGTTTQESFEIIRESLAFAKGEDVAIPVYIWSAGAEEKERLGKKVSVDIYRFPTRDAYMNAQKKLFERPLWASTRDFSREDLSGAQKQESREGIIRPGDNGLSVVVPPVKDDGWYAAVLTYRGKEEVVGFQVTPLSVYAARTEDSLLVWASDQETKKNIGSASVGIWQTSMKGQTDPNGVVRLPLPREVTDPKTGRPLPIIIEKDSKSVVLPLPIGGSGAARSAFMYMESDRPIYHTGDTAIVSGVIKPKDKSNFSNKTVTLTLSAYALSYFNVSQAAPINTITTTTSNTGAFSAKLPLGTLPHGQYEIQLTTEGELTTSQWISIEPYKNPAYRITVTPDRNSMFVDEEMTFRVHTAFFDDTPYGGLELAFSGDFGEGTIKTDAQGNATIKRSRARRANPEPRSPESLRMEVRPRQGEETDIMGQASVLGFFADTLFAKGGVTRTGDTATVTGMVVAADLAAYNQYVEIPQAPRDTELYWGKGKTGVPIKGTLYATKDIQKVAYDYYDAKEKKKLPVFTYEQRREKVSDIEATTSADGALQWSTDVSRYPGYEFEVYLELADSKQRRETIRWYWDCGCNGEQKSDWRIGMQDDNTQFTINQKKVVSLLYQDKPFAPTADSRILWYQVTGDGIEGERIGDTLYEIAPTTSHMPRFSVTGVIFDGNGYQEVSRMVHFDPAAMGMTVDITPAKKTYAPGEKMEAVVLVKDNSGSPVAADVNIAMIDEAYYANFRSWYEGRNALDAFLGDYETAWYAVSATSHRDISLRDPGRGGKGGGGGGAGSGVRSDFRDTACAMTIRTGADGRASIQCALPDSVTGWRAVGAAFDDAFRGATIDVEAARVTKALFIHAVMPDVLLEGDMPTVAIRAHGSNVSSRDAVEYTIDAPTMGLNNASKKSTAEGVTFDVPKTTIGEHVLMIKAKGAAGEDAVRTKTRVMSRTLSSIRKETVSLSAGYRLPDSIKKPITLTIGDTSRIEVYKDVAAIANNASSVRIESGVAATIAQSLLGAYFDQETQEKPKDMSTYQQADGGIALVPYGASDLEASAWIAYSGVAGFDRASLERYFLTTLGRTDLSVHRIVLAYFGLASLGKPYVQEQVNLLNSAALSPVDRLFLGLGLDRLGATEYSRIIVRDTLKDFPGEQGGYPIIRGDGPDATIQATLMTALLKTTYGDMDDALWQSGRALTADTRPTELMRVLYDARRLVILEERSVCWVKIARSGREEELDCSNGATTFVIPAEEQSSFSIQETKGDVHGLLEYEGERIDVPSVVSVGMTRSFSKNGTTSISFSEGDVVRISYSAKGTEPKGWYELRDQLPAGMIPYTTFHAEKGLTVTASPDGAIQGYFPGSYKGEIRVYARAVSGGTYGVRPAQIYPTAQSALYGVSSPATVSITPLQ